MRRAIFLILLLILVLAGIFLGGRNARIVTIDYYAGTMELTLAVALLLAFTLGMVLGAVAVWLGSVVRLKVSNRRLRRELAGLSEASPERLKADD